MQIVVLPDLLKLFWRAIMRFSLNHVAKTQLFRIHLGGNSLCKFQYFQSFQHKQIKDDFRSQSLCVAWNAFTCYWFWASPCKKCFFSNDNLFIFDSRDSRETNGKITAKSGLILQIKRRSPIGHNLSLMSLSIPFSFLNNTKLCLLSLMNTSNNRWSHYVKYHAILKGHKTHV